MQGGVWYTTANNPAFPLHVEDELELNLIVNGAATVRAGSELYRAARGDLVWLRPGHLHGLTERSPDLVLWVVMARGWAVELARSVDSNLGTGHAAELVQLRADVFAKLSRRCFELLRAQSARECFNRLLVEFLIDASRAEPAGCDLRPADPHRAVERAAELVSRGREPRWRLRELSKRVGLSAYELSRLFHRQLGVTLVHYANHERVQRFARLYGERPAATLLQNALDAGFGSYSQFFRIFRAVNNLTPEQFRALCEEGIVPKPGT